MHLTDHEQIDKQQKGLLLSVSQLKTKSKKDTCSLASE